MSLRRATLLAFALAATACSSLPDTSTGQRNACLPEAAMMAQALNEKGIPAKVLLLRFAAAPSDRSTGHALTIYQLRGHLWAWDSYWKSLCLRSISEPTTAGRAWLRLTHPQAHLIEASYLP